MIPIHSFVAPNMYPNLNDQLFRLNKINEVKDYFIAEIEESELKSLLGVGFKGSRPLPFFDTVTIVPSLS